MNNPIEIVYEGKWAEVCYAIDEIEWFSSRKINLSGTSPSGVPWNELLLADIQDLRRAIQEARKRPGVKDAPLLNPDGDMMDDEHA